MDNESTNTSGIPRKTSVKINISTWRKDSNGLYDYDSAEGYYMKESIMIHPPVQLLHNKNYISAPGHGTGRIISEPDTSSKNFVDQLEQIAIITKFRQENTDFICIRPIESQSSDEEDHNPEKTLYISIRNGPNQKKSVRLKAGMILRFGTTEFRIIELKDQDEVDQYRLPEHYFSVDSHFQASSSNVQQVSSEEKVRCKICLCDEETGDDPMISPCLCKGSILKIHLSCFKQCIDSKIKKEVGENGLQYLLAKMKCQLCYHPYPRFVQIGQKTHEMLGIRRPHTPYVILETINQNKIAFQHQQNAQQLNKSILLIKLKEDGPTKIGRSFQNHLLFSDITVSRKHAIIYLKNGQIVIQDTKSKFGTLIKLTEPICLNVQKQQSVKLQFGRSLFEFSATLNEEQKLGNRSRGSSKKKQIK